MQPSLTSAERLALATGRLHTLRRETMVSFYAYYEDEKILSRANDSVDSEVSRLCATRWNNLYSQATTLRDDILTGAIDDTATFNKRLDSLFELQVSCAALSTPNDNSVEIAKKLVSEWWCAAEKKKIVSLGYDSSDLPDS
jgi:hypothetical protein